MENQDLNIQKNIRYGIRHADSLDYNAMKCHLPADTDFGYTDTAV